MKKEKLFWAVLAAAVLIFGLASHFTGSRQGSLYSQQQILVSDNEGHSFLAEYEFVQKLPAQQIEARYQRQVGPAEQKQYTGILLLDFLKACNMVPQQEQQVVVESKDRYNVVLTWEELSAPENVYLVWEEGGKPLTPETGAYQLVIRNDQYSTRWVKQVVSVLVDTKTETEVE